MPFDPTSASRAVLLEVMNVLGAFRDELVIVGGWVPDLLYPQGRHMGSLDVDLAVSPRALANNAYETVLHRLLAAGYVHQTGPTRFVKQIAGVQEPVKVDLITGEYQSLERTSFIRVDELQINSLRGLDLAFAATDEITITGEMPDGTQNHVRARIVRPEAFILVKAFALSERVKHKDAYDIAFVLEHFPSTIKDLAERMRPLLENGLAAEGLQILSEKFASIDSAGPVWAANVAREQGADFEQARRAAFESTQELFRSIH